MHLKPGGCVGVRLSILFFVYDKGVNDLRWRLAVLLGSSDRVGEI